MRLWLELKKGQLQYREDEELPQLDAVVTGYNLLFRQEQVLFR